MKRRTLSRLSFVALVGLAILVVVPAHSAVTASTPTPLGASFHEVALPGFGDYQNTWPWGSAWYNGRLYIGTNRNIECTKAAKRGTYPPANRQFQCPPTLPALPSTLGAEIWSVDPNTTQPLTQSNWTENYVSPLTVPLVIDSTPTMGPRDVGFRGMSAYTESDGTQALYVSGVSIKNFAGSAAPPPSLLRSTDGATFQAVPADPGTTMGDINILTTTATSPCCMRDQASFKGYFYVTIVDGNGSGTLFASPTPQLGDNSFQQITPSWMPIYDVQVFDGHLYLGVAAPTGYSVWRTDCTAPPPGQQSCLGSAFTEIIPPGGGLPQNANVSVTSMAVFTDTTGIPHLYIGAATEGSSSAAGAELARVNQDDSWDLIAGTPRTVNGVAKNPLSGFGPGFGWAYNTQMWRMVEHQGVLFVGTYDQGYSYLKGTPQEAQDEKYFGFDLWASADGVNFTAATLDGFGNMYSDGVRSLVSTPYGLFVGATNHFGGLRMWEGALPAQALLQAPQNLLGETTSGGQAALAWQAPPHAASFHVYRAEVRPRSVAPPAGGKGSGGAGTDPLWVAGAYREIGVTSAPYFVDRSLPAGEHANYYVVTQETDGQLSLPSSIAAVPALAPSPTFHDAAALLAETVARGKAPARQAAMLQQTLQSAARRLQSGDIQGSQAALAALGRAVVAGAHTVAARQSAEELTLLLDRLSARATLASPHLGLVLRSPLLPGGGAAPLARQTVPGQVLMGKVAVKPASQVRPRLVAPHS